MAGVSPLVIQPRREFDGLAGILLAQRTIILATQKDGKRGDFSQRVPASFPDAELNSLAHSVNNLVETVDRGLAEVALPLGPRRVERQRSK